MCSQFSRTTQNWWRVGQTISRFQSADRGLWYAMSARDYVPCCLFHHRPKVRSELAKCRSADAMTMSVRARAGGDFCCLADSRQVVTQAHSSSAHVLLNGRMICCRARKREHSLGSFCIRRAAMIPNAGTGARDKEIR